MENVWAYLRANKLDITVFDSYDDIRSRLELPRKRSGTRLLNNPKTVGKGQVIERLV